MSNDDGALLLAHPELQVLGASYEPSFLDPGINATIHITPEVVFGLTEEDPTGSPTRWIFD